MLVHTHVSTCQSIIDGVIRSRIVYCPAPAQIHPWLISSRIPPRSHSGSETREHSVSHRIILLGEAHRELIATHTGDHIGPPERLP